MFIKLTFQFKVKTDSFFCIKNTFYFFARVNKNLKMKVDEKIVYKKVCFSFIALRMTSSVNATDADRQHHARYSTVRVKIEK